MRVGVFATVRGLARRCVEALSVAGAGAERWMSPAFQTARVGSRALFEPLFATRPQDDADWVERAPARKPRRWAALRALAFVACAIGMLLTGDTHLAGASDLGASQGSQLPRLRFEYGLGVAVAEAPTLMANETWPPSILEPLGNYDATPIKALAASLNYDPALIYRYVQETTTYVPTYGVSKGTLGVIIDRSGNAFDQAMAIVELLEEADNFGPANIRELISSPPSLAVGYVTLNAEQIRKWVGVAGPNDQIRDEQILALFRAGGVPITALGGGNFQIGHAWATVSLNYGAGDETYVLDAALKSVTQPQGLMDVAGAASDFAGISAGANIANELKEYADDIAAQIASAAHAEKSPQEILGAGTIIAADFAARRQSFTGGCGPGYSETDCLLQAPRVAQLGFSPPFHDSFQRIPAQYRTRVRVCVGVNNDGPGTLTAPQACQAQNHVVANFFADEVYGRRLSIEPDLSFSGAPWSPSIVLDGQTIATLNANAQHWDRPAAVRIEINHPYPGRLGVNDQFRTLGDAAHDFGISASTSVSILLGLGDTGPALATTLGGARSNYFDPLLPNTVSVTSGQTAKTMLGARWLAQTTRAARLHEAVNRVRTIQHHWAGAVFSTFGGGVTSTGQSCLNCGTPVLEVTRISVGGMASEIVLDGSTGAARTRARHAGEMTLAALANTLEGSVGEQSFNTPLSSSVARAWGSRGVEGEDCNAGGTKYLLFTPQDYSTRSMVYCDFSWWNPPPGGFPLGEWKEFGTGAGTPFGWRYAAAGYNVVTSNIGSHAPFPNVYWENPNNYQHTGGVAQGGRAYVAYRQADASSDIAFVTSVTRRLPFQATPTQPLDYEFKGGGAASDQRANLLEGQRILQDEFRDRSVFNGVDLRTGDFTYTAPPDLTLGEGEFPYRLTVQRQYRADDTHCANCPFGWTHNWDIELSLLSDGLEAMGARTYQQMHTTMAALRAAYLIYKDDTRSEIDRQVDGAKAMDWWRDKFLFNVAVYRQGHAQQLYLRDGESRFVGPPGHLCDATNQPCDEIFDEDGGSHRQVGGGSGPEDNAINQTYSRVWAWTPSDTEHSLKWTRRTADGQVQRFIPARQMGRAYFDLPSANDASAGELNVVRPSRYRIFLWKFPANDDPFGEDAPLYIQFAYHGEGEGGVVHDNALRDLYVNLPGAGNHHRICFDRDFGLRSWDPDSGDCGTGRATALNQDAWSSLSASNPGPRLKLNSFTSPAGYVERYEYEAAGAAPARPSPFLRLKRVFPARTGTPPSGESDYAALRLVYNSLGQVREVHDAFSVLNCPSCADPRPPVTIYSAGRSFGASVQAGVMDVRLQFDQYDRLIEQRERADANTATPVYHTWRMEYDGRNRVKKRFAPDGQRVEFTYNTRNLPEQVRRYPRPGSPEATANEVHVVDATYHPRWNVVATLTDAGSRQSSGIVRNVTQFNYAAGNAWQRLDSVVLPSAINGETGQPATSTWTFAYDGLRRPTTQTDPRTMATTFTYNSGDGRIQSMSQDRGASYGGITLASSFQRNNWGAVTRLDPPGPNYTDTTYDNDGRVLTTTGPLTTQTISGLDALGQLQQTFARVTLSGVTHYQTTYQEVSRTGKVTYAGRPTLDGTPPTAYVLTSYDHGDRPSITTDEEGRRVRLSYDMAGRVVREEREDVAAPGAFMTWKTIAYETNSNNIACIVDGEGRATTYEYNGFGHLKRVNYGLLDCQGTAPLASETFAHDPNGNLITHVTRGGQTINMWYDSRNRLIWKAQTAGAAGPTYAQARTNNPTYDHLGNLISIGSMDSASFCHAGFWYVRDGWGRIRRDVQGWGLSDVSPQRPCTADYKNVWFDYADAQGFERPRATKITWPDGFHVFYDLDDLDRVVRIRLCSSGGPGCTGAVIADYVYDELGRRRSVRMSGSAGALSLFVWEDDNDLAAVAHDATNDTGDVVFAAAFNRAGEPVAEDISNTNYLWKTALTATATTNALNQFPSWQVNQQGAETLTYDANGNLHSWRGRWYIHDPDNRLREVRSGSASGALIAQYEYDGLGRRVRKTTYSPTTTHTFYLYAGDSEIGEYGLNASNQSVLLRRFIPGPNPFETVAIIEAGTNAIKYLHMDRVSTVVAASNSTGVIADTERFAMSEWGEVLPNQFIGQPFRFAGTRFDAETGFHYARARYYTPELGRFLQTDPVGYEDSLSLYAYVRNDPLTATDPTGRQEEDRRGGGFNFSLWWSVQMIWWSGGCHRSSICLEYYPGAGMNLPSNSDGNGDGNGDGDSSRPPRRPPMADTAGTPQGGPDDPIFDSQYRPKERFRLYGTNWRARTVQEAMVRYHCEQCAEVIQGRIGGRIYRIQAERGLRYRLPRYRGVYTGWFHHDVVVKEGLVYDVTTGGAGVPMAEYEALWAEHVIFMPR
jgi:RHS repeat-associated protein